MTELHPAQLRELGFARVEIRSYGNAATAAGSPMFLMEKHFPAAALERHDPRSPSIIAL